MLTQASRATKILAALSAVPFLMIIILFEVLPLVSVGLNSLFTEADGPGLANYVDILTSRFQRNAFATSLLISIVTAGIGVALGLPIAVMLRLLSPATQRVVLTYSNLSANFTGFPVAFAFVIMFGISGFFTLLLTKLGISGGFDIYSTRGLTLVFAYFQVSLGILLIYPSLGAITPDIVEAAHLMGATPRSFWWNVGLPILWPSLLGSFILLFANAMGTYATALALAGGNANLVTIRIGELVQGDVFSEPNLADALSMLLVVTLAIPIGFQQLVLRRRHANE